MKKYYSNNLFYSKLNFNDISNKDKKIVKKKGLLKNLILSHLFYMSFPTENVFNIDFNKMDKLLKSMDPPAMTYISKFNFEKNKVQNFVISYKLFYEQKKISGGGNISLKLKNKKNDLTRKITNMAYKKYDNHTYLYSNRYPDITVDELTFAVIINYICSSPPVIFKNQKILDTVNEIYKTYIKNKKKMTRTEYLKINMKFKNRLRKIFTDLKNEKMSIEEQIMLRPEINKLNPGLLKSSFYLYDATTKTKPYIYHIDDKLFFTIKGTQSWEQVKQDAFSLVSKPIKDIIDDFFTKNKLNEDYINLLLKIKKHYGKYEYGKGFFRPVLNTLYPILLYLSSISNKKYKEIYIIGHSLGSAVAMLYTILFLYIKTLDKYSPIFNGRIIKLITFGEPPGIKNNKINKKLIKLIHKEMNSSFKYVRVVSFHKDEKSGNTYKDPIAVGHPYDMLFIDKIEPLSNVPPKKYNKIVSPNGELLK